jgi:hypothetical protein
MSIENGVERNAHPSGVLCTGIVYFYESERRTLHPSGVRTRQDISLQTSHPSGVSRSRDRSFA